MKRGVVVLFAFSMLVLAQPASRPSLSEPSLSPDSKEIVFVSGGDIWTVPLEGGEARLLLSHAATESRPLFSPDGSRLAFTSSRTGGGDIYVLDLATGDQKRITFHEALERVDAWSPDGKWIYFSTTLGDIGSMNDVYRVSSTGGTPLPYSADLYASEYFAAPAPKADVLAVTAKGIVSGQWWRNGHSHIDESEIWLRYAGDTPRYERISSGGAKDAWPMWSSDGKLLYYMSDRGGAENIWVKALGGSLKQVTQFRQGRVLWPSISLDGAQIVFERDFEIWRLTISTGKVEPVPIRLRGSPAGPATNRLTVSNQFRQLALSPDGKKVIFTAHGDVFAASAKDAGAAQRLTATTGLESHLGWAPDNRRVTYTSNRDGVAHIYLFDLASNKEEQLTSAAEGDASPYWSPDGKRIAFVRDGQHLMIYEVATKQESRLATGYFSKPPLQADRPLTWAPDSKWIAFAAPGNRFFVNASVVAVPGGKALPISFLPNTQSNSISWSPDGTYLLFDTGQRTENGRVARIDLIPRTPKFREDQFRDLFREEKPSQPATPNPDAPASTPVGSPQPLVPESKPSGKNVRIVMAEIRRRLTLLPTGVDVDSEVISPDGKWLLLIATAAGQQNLYAYSLDELSREPVISRQITSTAGSKSHAQFTPDSKEVYFLERGSVHIVNLETRLVRPLAVTAELDVNFDKEKQEVFQQAWSYLNDHFYDPKFHGADWKALRVRFLPQIRGARTADELRRLISLLLGELNASHLGITPPALLARTGNLGVRFNRVEYETTGHLQITQVIRLTPADVAGIKSGSYLLAVDDAAITAHTNLDELLEFKAGKRVLLTIADDVKGANKRELPVSPISGTQEKALLYRDWVESRRDYVHRASKGRIGYVHMLDMSSASLDQLYLDLDAENTGRDGVVVDIRNNSGGFVNAYALDVLARRGYLNMSLRGLDQPVPARTLLGQRSLERPTILLVNQHSLSDAEDFTEGYRSLGLGKVVGEPTAGWIIYTSNQELIDGSALRLPSIKITTSSGVDMERNPRPVDIAVERPFGESYSGKDTQLDVAVQELLRQIGSEHK